MNILGHDFILRYLYQGLSTGRLSPSLLFVGTEGVGKRSTALELAKCFSCRSPSDKNAAIFSRCDRCTSCERMAENNHSDLLILDRKSQAVILREKTETQTAIKIESIRYMDKFLRLLPTEGQKRTVIIDEAQKMTIEATNALLKILEEPPPSAQIILIVTDERSLPPTILSRCAILRFKPVPAPVLADWLATQLGADEKSASAAAHAAEGSFARAVALLQNPDEEFQIEDYELDEFFELVTNTNWRREGRQQAETALRRILASAQKKLEQGDPSQTRRMKMVLDARRQLDHHVSPKLVLENLYLEMMEK